MRIVDVLRRADWLSEDRGRAYASVLACAVLLFGVVALGKIMLAGLSDPAGRPIASDFDPFWAGARLALHGHPAAAYDRTAISAVEIAGAQLSGHMFPYLYPPVWMLLCLPLAALPYAPALLAFLLAGNAALMTCLRRMLPTGFPLLPVFGFPAAVLNAVIGQNGMVSAACFAGAALLLEARPVLAGACLGALAYKPQLAVCVPLALLAARRWAALAGAGVGAACLVLLSGAVLGAGAWRAFLTAIPAIGSVLADPEVWPKTIGVYAGMRLIGAGPGAAYAAQGAAAVAALACVFVVCARRRAPQAEMAVAASGAMLCTPYLMDYDLTCLAVPMAWLVTRGSTGGWRPWEKVVLAACYVLPLAARTLSLSAGIPLAPPLLAALLAVLVARARDPAGRGA